MEIPLTKTCFSDLENQEIQKVLASGWVMQGSRVEAFEKAVAHHCQSKFAIATSSGTTALHIALELAHIKKGDEVIVPSFSWIASANSIAYCGATPVFCDVDDRSYNMTPETVESKITKKTKAILLVHQFGYPCDLDGFSALAKKHKIELIEDAACATGSRYHNEPIGNNRYSRLVCFSFHPRKVITTGEGGMILTDQIELADQARILRNHGMKIEGCKTSFPVIGYNYRMTDLQAAIGISQMQQLPEILSERTRVAKTYRTLLGKCSKIKLPEESSKIQTNHQTFMVRLKTPELRNKAADFLKTKGVATRSSIAPIHHEPCYASSKAVLPHTDQISQDGLILPMYPSMTQKEIEYVCEQISQILA